MFVKSFKKYQSKPIERLAYLIKPEDEIEQNLPDKDCAVYPDAGQWSIDFVAHEKVNKGDYIVYLNEDDIYHCSAKVFTERNIIESEH